MKILCIVMLLSGCCLGQYFNVEETRVYNLYQKILYHHGLIEQLSVEYYEDGDVDNILREMSHQSDLCLSDIRIYNALSESYSPDYLRQEGLPVQIETSFCDYAL